MPLLKIDVVAGRTEEELTLLLNTIHDAMVESFQGPVRDRYQIVSEHPRARLIIQDTGLGFDRSDKVVVITAISRPRSAKMKKAFYSLLARNLETSCGIRPVDLMVSIVINSDEDWSFGLGRAQFLEGDL